MYHKLADSNSIKLVKGIGKRDAIECVLKVFKWSFMA